MKPIYTALLTLSILITFGCSTIPKAPKLTIVSPQNNTIIATQTAKQKAFLSEPRETRIKQFADEATRRKLLEAGWQEPCKLQWQGGEAPYQITIKRTTDGEIHWTGIETNQTKNIYNLEIAQNYTWSITDKNQQTIQGTFTTEGYGPRFLSFLGPYNCRDFGGWVGLNGHRVRQGMAFRTAGLNDNSRTGFTTEESAKSLDTNGTIATLETQLKKYLSEWENRQEEEIKLVQATLPQKWQVWRLKRPEPIRDLELLISSEMPDETETITIDEDYCANLQGIGDGWAILESTIDATEDGYVLLGCGADWYWALAVNGLPVRDRLTYGNNRIPHSINNHQVCIPVKKGTNKLRVLLGAGTTGFRWYCGPGKKSTTKEILNTERNYLGWLVKKLWIRSSGITVGASRLTPKESRRWLERFHVKTELDLRSEGETLGMNSSPIGPEVEWIRISCPAYQAITNDSGHVAIKKIFNILFDSTKYPLIFHCIGGRDRTGTISFLMNGLLGVSEEDLYYDWEATCFCQPGTDFQHRNCITPLIRSLNSYPGDTINARIESYIKSLGFTDSDISSFRQMLLEP